MPSRAGSPARIAHRHKLLFGAIGAVALILVGIVAGFVILLSGVMTTAATKQHFAVTHRLLDIGLKLSVENASRTIRAPPLDDPAMLNLGAVCFADHCAQCHGSPGVGPSQAAQGMLPIATSLSGSAKEWSPAALYYITKKGIRMTGMPAWEFRMSDEALWSTVAFVATLPQLTREDYDRAQRASRPCPRSDDLPEMDPRERGDMLLRQYACHSCHRIEGVVGPDSRTGPPLIDWRKRKYIAGILPNTHGNLVRWIMDPQGVSRHTLMPNLGVAETHAAEMATFLLTPQ